jgi:hypothetical protein
MRCNLDHAPVPKVVDPELPEFKTTDLGWIHFTEAYGWHTVNGTLLIETGDV